MPAPDLPAAPGTYVLILRLDAPARIIPGRLGPCELPAAARTVPAGCARAWRVTFGTTSPGTGTSTP